MSSKYSDTPPTPEDTQLRKKHTVDSINYNKTHMLEHASPIKDHIQGLQSVDPKKAASMSKNVKAALQGIINSIN